MAKMYVDFPDDTLGDLLDSDFEEMAEKMLVECQPIMQSAMQSAVKETLKDKSRTELVDSIKVYKPYKTKNGFYISFVGFNGKPSHESRWNDKNRKSPRKVTMNDIAFWLEYGNAHQPARPFLDRVTSKTESAVLNVCQKIFDEVVNGR